MLHSSPKKQKPHRYSVATGGRNSRFPDFKPDTEAERENEPHRYSAVTGGRNSRFPDSKPDTEAEREHIYATLNATTMQEKKSHYFRKKIGMYPVHNLLELFLRKTVIIIAPFSTFSYFIQRIQPVITNRINHITFCPHGFRFPAWGQWFFKIQPTIPWIHQRCDGRAQWHHRTNAPLSSQPWRHHNHRSCLHHLRHFKTRVVADQYSAALGVEVQCHKIHIIQQICNATLNVTKEAPAFTRV